MSSHQIEEAEPNQIAGFILNTFKMLGNNEYSKICYWAPDGTQFIIKDVGKFQKLVLPNYFRHNKMNSFIRQLNMYGFHKSRKDHTKSVFSHPLFQRDRDDLLITIKRKIKSKNQETYNQELQNIVETPAKKKEEAQQTTTNAKEMPQTGRQLNSVRQFSFQQNKLPSFNWGSRDSFTSKLNIGVSIAEPSRNDLQIIQQVNESQPECLSIQGNINSLKKQASRQMSELGPISMKYDNPSLFFSSIRK